MQKTFLLVFISATIYSCNAQENTDERITQAKSNIETKINQQSRGILHLESFQKTDGQVTNYGVEGYNMDFKITLVFKSDGWKGGNGFEGMWSNFVVYGSKPYDPYDPMLADVKAFKAGHKVTLTGTASFTKKESGWYLKSVKINSGIF